MTNPNRPRPPFMSFNKQPAQPAQTALQITIVVTPGSAGVPGQIQVHSNQVVTPLQLLELYTMLIQNNIQIMVKQQSMIIDPNKKPVTPTPAPVPEGGDNNGKAS